MNDDFEKELITELAHVFGGTGAKLIRIDEDGAQEIDLEATARNDRITPLDPNPARPDHLVTMYPDWSLIEPASNQIIKVGETLRDAVDEEWVLVGGRPPHNVNSTGRVYVEDDDGTREFFPSVFNLKWVYIGVPQE